MPHIGLDIGSYSVKACQMKEKGGKYTLVNFGVADISEELIEGMDPAQKDVLVFDAVKRVLSDNNIKGTSLSLSVSGDQVIVRYIKLPFMTREELKSTIRIDGEQYIPFNINECVLDFSMLGEIVEEGQKKIEVLLVAVKEEVVNQYISLVKSLGFDITVIDVDCFALQNAYEAVYGVKPEEVVALLNIGAKYSNINIIEGGVTMYSRDIPFGGALLTKDIARELACTFPEAEKIKKETGGIIIESEETKLTRIPSKDDKKIRIYGAMVPTINKLITEVRRAFDFYESSSKKKSITKIVLSGGTAKLRNIDKFISERMKLPVELFDAFKDVEREDPRIELKLQETYLYAPVSLGLSLRRPK